MKGRKTRHRLYRAVQSRNTTHEYQEAEQEKGTDAMMHDPAHRINIMSTRIGIWKWSNKLNTKSTDDYFYTNDDAVR